MVAYVELLTFFLSYLLVDPAKGEAITLGTWRIINQTKIIVPGRAAINRGLIFKIIAMPEPINAMPAK